MCVNDELKSGCGLRLEIKLCNNVSQRRHKEKEPSQEGRPPAGSAVC